MHGAATIVLSLLMLLVGIAMLASTVARGGGPLASGVILGLLFVALGAGRFYVAWARRHG